MRLIIKKINLYVLSWLLQSLLFLLFKTNRWKISGRENFEAAINNKKPVLICSWHSRFLSAVYYLKTIKIKNMWAISSNHDDSEIMAYFLKRSSFHLIRGSSTRGWDNVVKQMLKVFSASSSVVAITNDGPKGPSRIAKYGSYKIAKKSGAQIIALSSSPTKFWEIKSWDKLRLPKPFGTIYIEFSRPMDYSSDTSDNADMLTSFLNSHLNALENNIK